MDPQLKQQQKKGCFFFFLTCTQERIRNKGPRRDLPRPRSIPGGNTRRVLARPRLRRCFFSLCSRMCMLWGEGDWCIAACNAWAHACRSGAHRMQVGCVEQVSHRSCPPLGCPPEIIRGSTFMCKTVYDMIQSHFLPSRLDAVGERQHLGIYL